MKLLFVLLFAACGDSMSAPGSTTSLPGPVAVTNPAAPNAPAPAAAPTPVTAPTAPAGTMSVNDLGGMSKADLRVARNEVFARHGRAFSSEDLQAHFGSQDWYQVNADYSDAMLTDADTAKVALIASFETDQNPLEDYQFSGEPMLSFADASTVVVGDFASVYQGTALELRYSKHGDWIRTWEGSFPMAADASNITWYELNYEDASIKRSVLASDLTH